MLRASVAHPSVNTRPPPENSCARAHMWTASSIGLGQFGGPEATIEVSVSILTGRRLICHIIAHLFRYVRHTHTATNLPLPSMFVAARTLTRAARLAVTAHLFSSASAKVAPAARKAAYRGAAIRRRRHARGRPGAGAHGPRLGPGRGL